MKVHDAMKLIIKDGWYELKQKGTSHRQFKHPYKKGRVTIAGKLSGDLSPKTLASIKRQAGIE